MAGKLLARFIEWLNTPIERTNTMREITEQDELQEYITNSGESPIFLFKHSTRCPTSSRANIRVEEFIAGAPESNPTIVMVKVVETRDVSNIITDTLNVEHQSPQMLLVKNGESVWDASHHNINAENLNKAIAAHC